MPSPNVTRLLDEAKRLTDEERRQLRSLLDESTPRQDASGNGEALARLLLARGIINRIVARPTEVDIARFNAWKPVPMTGKPLSETIIEERR